MKVILHRIPCAKIVTLLVFFVMCVSCSSSKSDTKDTKALPPSCETQGAVGWQVLDQCREKGELLGVGGTGPSDVWAVGAQGQVLSFDGCEWISHESGVSADLWWVHPFKDGPVMIAGSDGTILKYDRDGSFEKMDTGVEVTLFGVWGAAPDDLWSIGFTTDDSLPGEIIRYDGKSWTRVTDLPSDLSSDHFFKVWGSSTDDVWVVGSNNLILRWDGSTWHNEKADIDTDWVTVTGRTRPDGKSDVVIVGGVWEATIIQRTKKGWTNISPEGFPGLQGVCMQPDGTSMATGLNGTLLTGTLSLPWKEALGAPEDLEGCDTLVPDYHACFADGSGGYYVVGGNFLGGLKDGALLHYGRPVPSKGL